MERDGHNKSQEALQIHASLRSKLYRTLVFVLSYLRAFFVSLHSCYIPANNCSEKAVLVLALNTILRDTEKAPVLKQSLPGSRECFMWKGMNGT